jgi:RNA polymerase sigma factor (sigma-70 family)
MASAAPEIPVLARNQAFETLYRRYVGDVYHYALALLRNPADAEDVTQTTFLNAYRAYQGGVEVEKPQNWLIKIAHNVARSRYARSSRRVREVPLEDHLEQLAIPDEERPNVEGLLQALWRLPFNQRAALVMRELEGRSYAEIAGTIGVSVSAVETLIFRARRSMRTKASAVRSLALIPLPSSLSKLFGGGGTIAGGGAAAGGGGLVGVGLVLKAAVALVAGLVTAGVVTHGSTHADAVPQQAPTVSPVTLRAAARQASVLPNVTGAVEGIRPGRTTATPLGVVGEARAAPGTIRISPGEQSQSAAAPAPTTSAGTTTTSRVTDTVAAVASTATAPLPTVPVQVPTVPAVPSVPSVPSVPVPLPAPPPVPTVP